MVANLKYPVMLITEDDVSGYSSPETLQICYEEKLDNNKLAGAMIVDSDGTRFSIKDITRLESMTVHGRRVAKVKYELAEAGKLSIAEFKSVVADTFKKDARYEDSSLLLNIEKCEEYEAVITHAGVYWQMKENIYLKYPVALITKDDVEYLMSPDALMKIGDKIWIKDDEMIDAKIVDVEGRQVIIKSFTRIKGKGKSSWFGLIRKTEVVGMEYELSETGWLSLDELKSLMIAVLRKEVESPSDICDRNYMHLGMIQFIKGSEIYHDVIAHWGPGCL